MFPRPHSPILQLPLLFPFLFLLSCLPVTGPGRGGYGSGQIRKLAQDIEEILADSFLIPATVAVKVVSTRTEQVLYVRNARKLLLPASNMKIFTGIAALALLGPTYRFPTLLLTDSLRNGVAYNLYVVGKGDPLLTFADLLEIAQRLKNRGVHTIQGGLVGDESHFDTLRLGRGWMWDEGPYGWATRIGALSVNRNILEVTVAPGPEPGAPLRVRIFPPSDQVLLENRGFTGTPGDSVSLKVDRFYRGGFNVVAVSGGLPVGSPPRTFSLNLDNPAGFVLSLLAYALRQAGIRTPDRRLLAQAPDSAETLYVHLSPPLAVAVREMEKVSSNFIAEQLLKTLGAEMEGPPGTAEKGVRVIRRFLAQAGVDTTTFVAVDGSGVSRYNLVSADHLVRILLYAYRNFRLMPDFLAALPAIGVDGTLRNRLKGTEWAALSRAKTGSLARVSTLSGYAATKGGDVLVYSILFNGFVGPTSYARALQDSIVVRLMKLE